VPAGFAGHSLLTKRADALLRLPENIVMGAEANVVGHLSFLTQFKVSEPVRVVGIGEIANLDMAFNGQGSGVKQFNAASLTCFIHLVMAKMELVAGVDKVTPVTPRFALGWMAASGPMPQRPEQLLVEILKGALADPVAVEMGPAFQFGIEQGQEVKRGGVGMG